MLVGIGGASNSGKSWLAKKLKGLLHNKDVLILCQDNYVYPTDKIPLIKDHTNWEIPESIDFQKFKTEIIASNAQYDYVIVEGLMVFQFEDINQILDKKIFLNISKEEFFKRKSIDLRWGREPDWYIQHIWDSYLKFGIVNSEDKSILQLSSEFIDVNKALNFLF